MSIVPGDLHSPAMLSYQLLKSVHVTCAILSMLGFVLRGVWMLQGSPLLGHRLARTLPHINDSVLLAAAIGLSLQSRQYPLSSPWLTAKLIALLCYIVLGSIALKRGSTRSQQMMALVAALAVLAYIFAVAISRRPWLLSAV